MRLPLQTAAYRSPTFKKLEIHLNDNGVNSGATIARNILIAHIIFSPEFNPTNNDDLQYVWDIWYNFQWDTPTTKRFLKDLDLLLTNKFSSSNIRIPNNLNDLKAIWSYWKVNVEKWDGSTIDKIIEQRFYYCFSFLLRKS